jgi:hypothetical protein
MAFDWVNYLQLAEELAARPDEAAKRAAISRAYYFVYNIAFARAEVTVGRCREVGSKHVWCWKMYRRSIDPTCKELGRVGNNMKRRRIEADYERATRPKLDDEVQVTLMEARKFQADLASLPGGLP